MQQVRKLTWDIGRIPPGPFPTVVEAKSSVQSLFMHFWRSTDKTPTHHLSIHPSIQYNYTNYVQKVAEGEVIFIEQVLSAR